MLSAVQLILTRHNNKMKEFSLSLDYFTMFEVVRMQTVWLNRESLYKTGPGFHASG